MSLSIVTTTVPYSLSSSVLINKTTKAKPLTMITKKHLLVQPICYHKQHGLEENQLIIPRRSALVGLGVLTGLIAQPLMATKIPDSGPSSFPEPLPEFGPEPRPLNSTIRVLVPRAPKPQNGFGEEENVEILVVDGVEVKDNNPVRLDVYIAKAEEGKVGGDLGELAGSLIDLARFRVGRRVRKMALNLGITYLVKDIGAQDCEKLLVSLVPRTGDMVVEGVHIENVTAE